MLAGLLLEWERQWDMQNPLVADQGKHFSLRSSVCVAGRNAATPATPAAAYLPRPPCGCPLPRFFLAGRRDGPQGALRPTAATGTVLGTVSPWPAARGFLQAPPPFQFTPPLGPPAMTERRPD